MLALWSCCIQVNVTLSIFVAGIHDIAGHAVVLYDAACVTRAALSHIDVARVMLYYATLPGR